MALFSRRGKRDDSTPVTPESIETGSDPADTIGNDNVEDAARQSSPGAAFGASTESVPQVGISVSTFGQPHSARPVGAVRPPAEAPAPSQAVPGLPDNVVLQAALAALPAQPQHTDVMNVMRQALQGQLYVRAQGDAQAQLAAGSGISLAITTLNDKRFLLAFSGGAPLQTSTKAEGAEVVSAIGQAAHHIFQTAVESGYDGVYLDHANPQARLILPIALISKALDEGEPPFELKTMLVGERDDATASQIADVITRTRVWVAGGTDPEGRIGVAEARNAEGIRRLEVFSHPLEVLAMGRGDRPLPLAPEQLAAMIASEPGLSGIILDPAGPWIEVDRDTLAPLLALAS